MELLKTSKIDTLTKDINIAPLLLRDLSAQMTQTLQLLEKNGPPPMQGKANLNNDLKECISRLEKISLTLFETSLSKIEVPKTISAQERHHSTNDYSPQQVNSSIHPRLVDTSNTSLVIQDQPTDKLLVDVESFKAIERVVFYNIAGTANLLKSVYLIINQLPFIDNKVPTELEDLFDDVENMSRHFLKEYNSCFQDQDFDRLLSHAVQCANHESTLQQRICKLTEDSIVKNIRGTSTPSPSAKQRHTPESAK